MVVLLVLAPAPALACCWRLSGPRPCSSRLSLGPFLGHPLTPPPACYLRGRPHHVQQGGILARKYLGSGVYMRLTVRVRLLLRDPHPMDPSFPPTPMFPLSLSSPASSTPASTFTSQSPRRSSSGGGNERCLCTKRYPSAPPFSARHCQPSAFDGHTLDRRQTPERRISHGLGWVEGGRGLTERPRRRAKYAVSLPFGKKKRRSHHSPAGTS